MVIFTVHKSINQSISKHFLQSILFTLFYAFPKRRKMLSLKEVPSDLLLLHLTYNEIVNFKI